MDGSTNHGFDWDLETLTTETFRFFKTSNMEQTMSIARNPKNGHVYRRFPKKQNEPSQWPYENLIPGFRAYFQIYFEKMTKFSQVLLKGIKFFYLA